MKIEVSTITRKEQADNRWWDRAKRVSIDGEVWGYFLVDHLSRYGTRYKLTDDAACVIDGTREVRSSSRRQDISPSSLPDRLLDCVREAIADGRLTSPAERKRRIAEEQALVRASREKADRERRTRLRARFEQRARENYLGPYQTETHLLATIVDAMEWAHSISD